MTSQMKIDKNDIVLIAAGILLLLIVGESVYCLHFAPPEWRDTYNVVVKGTLEPLFTTVVTLKLVYTVGVYVLKKFPDK